MAGNLKVSRIQLGDSVTTSQNFTLSTNLDGSATFARGNVGATTQDVFVVGNDGALTFPIGVVSKSINGGQLAGMRNLILNGSVSIWQRGASFSPTVGIETYTADQWISYSTGAGVVITNGGGPSVNMPNALSATGATGNLSTSFYQRIEAGNVRHLANKSTTFSGYVYSTIVSTANVVVYSADSVDTYSTKTLRHTYPVNLSVGWNYVSVNIPTFNATASSNGFQIGIEFGATVAGVVRAISGVQLEEGSVATPFEQRHYSVELMMCQRYYEYISPYQIGQYGIAAFGSGHQIFFKTRKRVVPTIIQTNMIVNNCSTTVNANTINVDGYTAFRFVTSTAGFAFTEYATASAVL